MNELRSQLAEYATRAAEVLSSVYPDAQSILWKGSALKPWDGPYDFIPRLSDLDLHVYRPGGLENVWNVRRALFDATGPVPGETMLQLLVIDADSIPDEWTLFEETYEVLVGDAPPKTETNEPEMRERDIRDIERFEVNAADIRRGVVDRPGSELWPYLRRVRWMFPTVLNRVASVSGHSPALIWTLNRTGVLDLTKGDPAVSTVRTAAVEYFEAAVIAAADAGANPDTAETALRRGHDLLVEASDWLQRTRS